MKYLVVTFCLAFLTCSQLFAGETSDRWIGFAGKSPEHRKLHNHAFYKDLENGTFDQNELQVFIEDRVLFFGYFEERLKTQLSHSDLPKEILYRSRQYQEEADLFSRLWQDSVGKPSQAAQDYVAHLKGQSDDTVLFHYLIHIAGEAFGAQAMAKSIQKKPGFEQLGESIRSLGDQKQRNARTLIHQFGDLVFPDESLNQTRPAHDRMSDEYVQAQVRLVFMYSAAMFDLAHDAKAPDAVIVAQEQAAPTDEQAAQGFWSWNTFARMSTPYSWTW